jgi:hypothetical protein
MHIAPRAGQWYINNDTGNRFEVIGVDLSQGVIDIHDYAGEVYDIDFDEWRGSPMEEIRVPDDLVEDDSIEGIGEVESEKDAGRLSFDMNYVAEDFLDTLDGDSVFGTDGFDSIAA